MESVHFELQSTLPKTATSLSVFSDDGIPVYPQIHKKKPISFRKKFEPKMGEDHPLRAKDLKPDRDMKKMVKKFRLHQLE